MKTLTKNEKSVWARMLTGTLGLGLLLTSFGPPAQAQTTTPGTNIYSSPSTNISGSTSAPDNTSATPSTSDTGSSSSLYTPPALLTTPTTTTDSSSGFASSTPALLFPFSTPTTSSMLASTSGTTNTSSTGSVTPSASMQPQTQTTPTQTTAPSSSGMMALTRELAFGMRGNDVTWLQAFLAEDTSIYPEGLVTGYFGTLTQAAVTRYQALHNLPPIGRVGPETMTLINTQMALGQGPSASGASGTTQTAPTSAPSTNNNPSSGNATGAGSTSY